MSSLFGSDLGPDGMVSAPSPGSDDMPATDVLSPDSAHQTEDRPDFTAVVAVEIAVLLRVAYDLTGSAVDAEDVVQETLIRAHQGWDRFDGRYPRAWLLTILRRTFLNSLRRTRPALLADDWSLDRGRPAFGVPSSQTESAEDIVLAAHYAPATVAALEGLSPDHRAALWLVDVEDLSYREAAQVLGVPEGTVVSRLSRARSRFRAAISQEGF